MTPTANAMPWLRMALRLVPLVLAPPAVLAASPPRAKPRILSDNTGNTQGIRFRIAPPIKANSSARPNEIDAADVLNGRPAGAAAVPATTLAIGNPLPGISLPVIGASNDTGRASMPLMTPAMRGSLATS